MSREVQVRFCESRAVRLRPATHRILPRALSSRALGDAVRRDYDIDPAATIYAVMPDRHIGPGELAAYAATLSALPTVRAVQSGAGVFLSGVRLAPALPEMVNEHGSSFTITTTVDPYSEQGRRQLVALRAVPSPAPVLFGGDAAVNMDSVESIRARLPLAVAIVTVATVIAVFLFTGSVVLPLKALLLNLLSLTTTFGAIVWVFQEGHLSHLLAFTAPGYTNALMPLLVFCIAFGISMDYELFLLARIREEWLRAAQHTRAANTRAVAAGIAHTGRIFTSSAALMAVVFIAVGTSSISAIKLVGIGLTLAVIIDATMIRCLLAPALMQLMGTANWWAPKSLAKLHCHIDLTGRIRR